MSECEVPIFSLLAVRMPCECHAFWTVWLVPQMDGHPSANTMHDKRENNNNIQSSHAMGN